MGKSNLVQKSVQSITQMCPIFFFIIAIFSASSTSSLSSLELDQ